MVKRKKVKTLLAVLIACSVLLTISVSAYNVGQNIRFDASNAEGSTTGGTNIVTRTEEERLADNANLSANSAWSDTATTFLSENIQSGGWDYIQSDGSIITNDGMNTPFDILSGIASYKDSYNPIGYYYDTVNNRTDNVVSPTYEEWVALEMAAEDEGVELNEQVPNLNLDLGTGGQSLRDMLMNLGGYTITLPGGYELIEFPTYKDRLIALNMYLQSVSASDEIVTQYIVEIKCESSATSQLWNSNPIPWHTGESSTLLGNNRTHLWLIECLESDVGYIPAQTLYSNSTLNYTFYQPGRYHVTATQIIQQTYCEAISYSINEYWVVADTGQIIWKNESTGTNLGSMNDDVPMSEQSTNNVSGYSVSSQGTTYYTALDMEVVITSNDMDAVFKATDMYTNDFSTYRIE